MKKIKYKIISDRNYLILNGPTEFWDYTDYVKSKSLQDVIKYRIEYEKKLQLRNNSRKIYNISLFIFGVATLREVYWCWKKHSQDDINLDTKQYTLAPQYSKDSIKISLTYNF